MLARATVRALPMDYVPALGCPDRCGRRLRQHRWRERQMACQRPVRLNEERRVELSTRAGRLRAQESSTYRLTSSFRRTGQRGWPDRVTRRVRVWVPLIASMQVRAVLRSGVFRFRHDRVSCSCVSRISRSPRPSRPCVCSRWATARRTTRSWPCVTNSRSCTGSSVMSARGSVGGSGVHGSAAVRAAETDASTASLLVSPETVLR